MSNATQTLICKGSLVCSGALGSNNPLRVVAVEAAHVTVIRAFDGPLKPLRLPLRVVRLWHS
jgi:hypothetical protein